MKFENEYQEFQQRTARVLEMGGAARVAKQKKKGRLNARERVSLLFDNDSFVEVGRFAHGQFPGDTESTPADGKVCGYGKINGRTAAVISHDITVKGASSSPINVQKMTQMRKSAQRNGFPLIFLNESTGARMPETMGAEGIGVLGKDTEQFVRLRDINYVAAVLGPAFGTAAWFTQLSDFVVMRSDAFLAVASSKVTSMATSDKPDMEVLAGAKMQATVTGKADRVVSTDEEAIQLIKRFLSYMPANNQERPPFDSSWTKNKIPQEAVLDILPDSRNRVYDIRKICSAIADDDSIFSLKSEFANEAFTALGRIEGQVIGFVASNPIFKAGALGPDACDKICQFLVLCDSFNVPIVFLMDTPGFAIGPEGEAKKAPGKIINFMSAVQMCTVPKFTLMLRKGYGQAFMNFGATRNVDEFAAWFTADVGFMDPNVSRNVILADNSTKTQAERAAVEHFLMRGTSAYDLAGIFGATAVIDPRASRTWLATILNVHSRSKTGGIGKHLMGAWPTTL